jgi:ribosomal protein L24E
MPTTARFRNGKGKFCVSMCDDEKMPLPPKRVIHGVPSSVELLIYARPPLPMIPADDCNDLPDGPGIYFVWENGRIVYVGKTVRLCQRCCFQSHDSIRRTDHLSWLEYPKSELFFAECYYIGALRPERNKGHGPIIKELA